MPQNQRIHQGENLKVDGVGMLKHLEKPGEPDRVICWELYILFRRFGSYVWFHFLLYLSAAVYDRSQEALSRQLRFTPRKRATKMDMQEILGLGTEDFDGVDFAESSDESDGEQPSSSAAPFTAPVPLFSTNDSNIIGKKKVHSKSDGERASTSAAVAAANGGGASVGSTEKLSVTAILVGKPPENGGGVSRCTDCNSSCCTNMFGGVLFILLLLLLLHCLF